MYRIIMEKKPSPLLLFVIGLKNNNNDSFYKPTYEI